MPSPDVSLVIVSRNRPQSLRRLLISLRFLHYRHFEAVVVSADNPRRDFSDIPGIERVRFVPLDEANIARARNHGIRFSAGEIVAFCDDDAVPEPTWLDHLTQPFLEPRVGAAGGYVRGRNGISFQWRAGTFDRFGSRSEIELASDEPVILSGDATTGIKTEGTNCAFRRKALVELGGFDENFRYFLDETDMNYRLGLAGWKTAIVPRAQVHHSYMANS
ncbi:MAG: glycosyltransferase family 2 protein, partial [Paracoccaceae bacterium]